MVNLYERLFYINFFFKARIPLNFAETTPCMKIGKLIIIALVVLACRPGLNGQKIWNLEACIRQAVEKSLQVESAVLAVENTEVTATQTQHSRFPTLNASTNATWNFGRTIDPTRNEFITETFFNNGVSLSTGVTLFNAGRISNSIKQSAMDNRAAVQNLEQVKRDIALNAATFYLNILFAKESIVNAQKQLAQTKNQQQLLEKQIAVGNRPENDRIELEAQLAANEQTLVEAENQFRLGTLNMKQLLRLPPEEAFDIEVPQNLGPSTDPDEVTFEILLQGAMATQPSVAASEWSWKSTILGEKIAASQLYPTIGVGGSLRSNYSNKGFDISGYDEQIINQTVYINGQEVTVGFPQNIPRIEQTPYISQFQDNLSYGFGVTMSIPIYNNYAARLGVQRAKLGQESARVNFEQVKESLKITVGQALNDAKATKARFIAAEKTRRAQQNLYNNAMKRFDNGGINTFELARIKMQVESAEINALISKYDYIFRTRVLDFYLGKGISFASSLNE